MPPSGCHGTPLMMSRQNWFRQWLGTAKPQVSAWINHYDDVTMSLMASQITSPTIVCSIVYSGADPRKHQSSASLAFVRGIHRGPVNSPHKWPVTRKKFPFGDVIICRHMTSLDHNELKHPSSVQFGGRYVIYMVLFQESVPLSLIIVDYGLISVLNLCRCAAIKTSYELIKLSTTNKS